MRQFVTHNFYFIVLYIYTVHTEDGRRRPKKHADVGDKGHV